MKTDLPEAGKGFQKRNGVCPRRARLMKNEKEFAQCAQGQDSSGDDGALASTLLKPFRHELVINLIDALLMSQQLFFHKCLG